MARLQLIIFINGDCSSSMSENDLEILKSNFENYEWDEFKTFKLHLHYDMFKIIHSTYRIPDEHKMNNRRETIYNLSNYLPIVTIETLSYLDYLGEKIYGCVKQPPLDSEEEELDYEVSSSEDINKLMNGLRSYLEKNKLDENHDVIKEQVEKIEIMSRLAKQHNFEIIIFDENI